MQKEIEAKFLNQNHDAVRAKLQGLGAICEKPMRMMRRVTMDNDKMHTVDGFLRVRDEGDRVTITYKQFDDLSSATGTYEIEALLGGGADLEKVVDIINKLTDVTRQSMQESKRETWRRGEVEVVLDEWPWLEPYIEIEAPNEKILREFAAEMGYDYDKEAVFGDVMAAYRVQYPHLTEKDTVGSLPAVRFDDPLPDLLKNPT